MDRRREVKFLSALPQKQIEFCPLQSAKRDQDRAHQKARVHQLHNNPPQNAPPVAAVVAAQINNP
jgi:hypothetical protein